MSPSAEYTCFCWVFEEMPLDCSSGTLVLGTVHTRRACVGENQPENWLRKWF